MNCEFEVIACGEDREQLISVAYEALDEVERMECYLSRFIETSDIGRINANAGGDPVRVSPETIEVLDIADRLWEETEGAFDVTAVPFLQLWQDARRRKRPPSRTAVAKAMRYVGTRYLYVSPEDCTVSLEFPGMGVDLGAIGKGYAVDRAMEVLMRKGVTDAAVCGAESSMRVIGTPSGSPGDKKGWLFRPRDPLNYERRVSAFRLQGGAIGMSAQQEQRFRYRGEEYGHILDARTGWPVWARFATLVVAPTAAEADVLATAFLVLGPENSAEVAKLHPGVSVAFIDCGATPGKAQLNWIVRSEDLPAELEPAEITCRETTGIPDTEM